MTIPDPYARSTFRGKPLDNATIAALKVAEAKLGYELTIFQGIGGASASAGTHTEGRAVDLAPWDHERKVRVLRDLGFAAWYRPELPGVWSPHIHAILIFESRSNSRGLAPVGFDQIRKYDAGQDGLAGSTRDPNPYRPTPKRVFTREQYRAQFVPPKPTLTVVTWNMGDGPDEAKTTALDKLAAQGAQVICLQEASDRHDMLEAWAKAHGWLYYFGDGSEGSDAVPILTAPKVPVTRFRTLPAVAARYVGPGAGPDRAKAKVINVARIEGGWRVLNTHMIASAQRPGRRYRLRRIHFREHLAVLVDSLSRIVRGTQISVGDFNATPEFRLLAPLRQVAVQVVKGATLGTRTVDLVWIVRGRAIKSGVFDMPSDHRAAVVTVEKG